MTDATPTGSISAIRVGLSRLFNRSAYYDDLGEILRIAKANHPKAELGIIEKAFAVAEEAHKGQLRKSGE